MAEAKANKKESFKDMTSEDLKNRLLGVAEELHGARQKQRVGQFKKISELKRLRKEIARIKTTIRAREIEAGKKTKAA